MDNEKSNNYTYGYGLVYQNVIRNKNISIEAKAIYAYLCAYAGNKGECYPKIDLMISELNISKSRFYKYLNQLIQLGIVFKYQNKNKNLWTNTIYKINHIYQNRDTQNRDTQNEDTQNEDTQNEDTQNEDTQNRDTQNEDTQNRDTQNEYTNNNSFNNNNFNNNSFNINKKLYSSDEEYNQKAVAFCSSEFEDAEAAQTKKEYGDAETAHRDNKSKECEDAETARKANLKKQINIARQRYNSQQLEVIDNFFEVLKYTRRGGKIADNVILNIYKTWVEYEAQKVIFGLNVYINNPALHDKKESYVLGIIRNTTTGEINNKFNKRSEEDGKEQKEYTEPDPYENIGHIEL